MSRAFRTGVAMAMTLAAVPAIAQFSDSYNFLKAVRDGDGAKAQEFLNKPGAPDLDSRDSSTGETALHIVVRKHDDAWTSVLLARGAKTEARDAKGDTPLLAAVRLSDVDAARLLLQYGANPNAIDGQGDTCLVMAVQHRDLPMTRLLISAGADPKIADRVAGKTPREYATDDPRGGQAILKILDEAKPKAAAPISGPIRK